MQGTIGAVLAPPLSAVLALLAVFAVPEVVAMPFFGYFGFFTWVLVPYLVLAVLYSAVSAGKLRCYRILEKTTLTIIKHLKARKSVARAVAKIQFTKFTKFQEQAKEEELTGIPTPRQELTGRDLAETEEEEKLKEWLHTNFKLPLVGCQIPGLKKWAFTLLNSIPSYVELPSSSMATGSAWNAWSAAAQENWTRSWEMLVGHGEAARRNLVSDTNCKCRRATRAALKLQMKPATWLKTPTPRSIVNTSGRLVPDWYASPANFMEELVGRTNCLWRRKLVAQISRTLC